MKPYSHLNISERNVIKNMLSAGKAKKEIAQTIGKHLSCIYREINRFHLEEEYKPEVAQQDYKVKRLKSVYIKQWDTEIYKFLKEEIKSGKSPDAIAGRQKALGNKSRSISHQTIYNWIIKGYLGKGIVKHLVFGKKGYKKSKNTLKSLKNKDKKRIDKMPDIAKTGTEVGHFQGDTIHGKGQTGAMATFVDVKSRYIKADIMRDKTANTFSECMRFLFSDTENDKLKTLLQDNGSEMANYKTDAQMLNCEIFFTYPGRPWEKALIENSNRLLRRFFPKKMKFTEVTREMVLQAVNWLNNLPRKSLGYRTAYEVFHNIEPFALDT